MKRIAFLFVFLLVLLPFGLAWGGGDTYYARLSLSVDSQSTGSGKVYAGTSGNVKDPQYDVTSSTDGSGSSSTLSFYAYAQADKESKFSNWSDGSADNPHEVKVTTTSKEQSKPTTMNLSAFFVPKETFSITYECEHGSYKVGALQLSSTQSPQTYEDDQAVVFTSPSPDEGYEFAGWYIKYGNGERNIVSYYTELSYKFSETTVFGAYFRRKETVVLNFLQPPSGGGFTIDGAVKDSLSGEGSVKVELVARPENPDKAIAKWYLLDEKGARVDFARGNSVVKTFSESTTVGVEFEEVNQVLWTAVEAAQAGEGVVTLDRDAEVVAGTTVTIPAGVTINLGEHTLFVDGTLENQGVINGMVSKCTKLYRQLGNGLQPFNPYENKKYWNTVLETPGATSSGVTTSGSHLTVINGFGEACHALLPASSTPVVAICSVNGGIAINHITGITDTSITTITSAFNSSTNRLALLLSSQTYKSSEQIAQDFGIVDGAGCKLTMSPKNTSTGYRHVMLNGSIECTVPSSKGGFYGAWWCYNCSAITIANLVNKYAAQLHVYDCKDGQYITRMESSTDTAASINYYSGGPYDPANMTKASQNVPSLYKIYGGFYKTKPPKERNQVQNTEFYQQADGYWHLEPNHDPNVAQVGNEKFLYLEEAVESAVQKGTATVLMLRNATIEHPVTIPSGVTVGLDLAGCLVTAPTGFAINNGNLNIYDSRESLTASGITCAQGCLIDNNGEVHVTYGNYSGQIRVNGGSDFVTHHGSFATTFITGGNLEDVKDAVDLRGGRFKNNPVNMLEGSYASTNSGGWWWVGEPPEPETTPLTLSGAEIAYAIKPLASRDAELYRQTSLTSVSMDDWTRRAEVLSMVAPHLQKQIDCVLEFDRDIGAGSITAIGQIPVPILGPQSREIDLDQDVQAGTVFKVLSPVLTSSGSSQITYTRLLAGEFDGLAAGVKNNNDVNVGTRVVIGLTIGGRVSASRAYVFGAGSNKAMIRPETGSVTFYQTLADAVNAVSAGGTVMLCNDGATGTAIGKVCTIDLNGFSLSAGTTLSAAAGYQMDVSADGRFYTFTVAEVVTPTISASVVAATTGGDGVVVTGAVPTGLTGATYALLKESTTGTFEQVGGAAGMSSPDFTIVETGWYKIAVTANGTTVESPETIGVLKYAAPGAVEDQAEQTTIVAVPWRVTLDGLLRKADFTSATGNDWQAAIKAYNAVGNTYEMWTLTDGTWVPCSIVSAKENGKSVVATSAAASSRELERGGAVWVTRKNAVKPFFLCGICPDEAPAATSLASGWNLVANPLLTPVDLDRAVTGAVAGDQIIVPSARGLGQTNYSFKDGIWGYMKAETVTYTIGGKSVSGVKHTWTPAPKIEPGQGFWFVSGGDDRKIDWTAGK